MPITRMAMPIAIMAMGNLNPSLFLGNAQWNLVKQYKNSDL